jgi:filamentous hemagglutinin family protein
VAQGLSNQQIADSLVISERTARTHVSNILGKLGVASRTQAALLAIREGITPAPPAS